MQQTSFPYEVIIGEDCSTDNTREVIMEYCRRYPGIIKLVTSDSNVGARRNGIRIRNEARGKYIAVCEGDDYWTDPHKLQKQVDFLEAHPDHVLCYHYVNRVDKDDLLVLHAIVERETRYYESNDIFLLTISLLSVVFRNCLTFYPEEFVRCFNGDFFLLGMLSGHGKAARLGFVGAHYRVHSGGVYSGNGKLENMRLSLATRKLMLKCSYFNKEQRAQIQQQVIKWRKRYVYYYFKLNLKRIIGLGS